MLRPITAALAAALLLSGCNDAASPGPRAGSVTERVFGKIRFRPCSLTSPQSTESVEAQCARYAVPEDRSKPDGRKVMLNIAWLPATQEGAAQPDPVFLLAGGPGQAATEVWAPMDRAFAEVRKNRDVILVDQRGTGQSNPLTCKDEEGQPAAVADPGTRGAETVEFVKRCLARLDADPRFYTTTEAVQDLEAVRAALGAPQVNLIGVSYGTRVAQQYTARHPDRTRTIVLDGVVPNELVVGGEFARTFDRALGLQDARCRQDATCKARFPTELRSQLRQLKARLETAPVPVEYRDPGTGELEQGTLTADTLTGLSHAFSYMPQLASLLPVVLDEAAQGRYAPLMSLSKLTEQMMGGQMSRGMQLSVVCAEDADRYRADPADAGTVLGPDLATMFFSACEAWPKGRRPADFNQPLASPVPALLMSGELDPVTPPEYGERVLKGLPNARHVVLRGQAHNVFLVGCMPKLLARFIESADAKALDTACLESVDFVPPFTSFNGWEP
ncbi:alpha/beta hydrolase [Lysobacter korlensis]|uniref:Alpha/beta hydrolase n=1 Tax=Lysobacter korlensis TaxID=553636 RepID=A0ABV6RHC3_9GAMM